MMTSFTALLAGHAMLHAIYAIRTEVGSTPATATATSPSPCVDFPRATAAPYRSFPTRDTCCACRTGRGSAEGVEWPRVMVKWRRNDHELPPCTCQTLHHTRYTLVCSSYLAESLLRKAFACSTENRVKTITYKA